MAVVLRPLLRPLEIIPVGSQQEPMYVLRDPEGFGRMVALPAATSLVALLMDGRRTLAEIQAAFLVEVGIQIEVPQVQEIVHKLDGAYLLAGKRFERHRQRILAKYRDNPVRPAAHAGGAYAEDPEELREQLAEFFTRPEGPGAIHRGATAERSLRGLISPHVDPYRGGATFAWAYKRVAEECRADVFVIFGTAHTPLEQWFSISCKDFATPLGTVPTDRDYIGNLARHLARSVAGQQVELFEDEVAHRSEHSIEFQTVFLQYALGGVRPLRIVPVLVGSFHEFIDRGMPPDQSPEIQAFLAALRAAEADYPGRVCYVSGADLAHLGQRFGDEQLLDPLRLAEQSADDRQLLELARRCDANGFFSHVGAQNDRNRICGLSPTYMLLQAIQSADGELLRYDQTVEPDGTSCVSFASMAFY